MSKTVPANLAITPAQGANEPAGSWQRAWQFGSGGSRSNTRFRRPEVEHLTQAMKLDPEAAIMACAWGAFQVQGDIWKEAGFASPYDMVNQVYAGLSGHFKLFVGYIKVNHLAKLLQEKNWAAFAKRYNGKDYAVNHYDTVMQKNYESFAGAA